MDENFDNPDNLPRAPINPLVIVRENIGLTQEQLAEYAGMTRMAIIRYEQGLFVHPSTDYLTALADHATTSPLPDAHSRAVSQFARNYRDFRLTRIQTTIGLFRAAVETRNWIQQTKTRSVLDNWRVHPFVSFRKMLAVELRFPDSQIHFCVLTCFHPSQLASFEKGETKVIPERLSEILLQAGFDVDTLQYEIENYLRND